MGFHPKIIPCHLKATKLKIINYCQGKKELMCARYMLGNSACHGDSGGPLTVNKNGVHVVVGVVRSGWDCSGNMPSIYVRVTSFLPWIRMNIKDGDCGRN